MGDKSTEIKKPQFLTHIVIEERGYKIPYQSQDEPRKDDKVFYNKVMKKNRDITEVALKTYKKHFSNNQDLKICDPLAGTGIRGIRYSKYAKKTLINDANPSAVEIINKAIDKNDIKNTEVTEKDANLLLSENFNQFDYLDIDPYGSFVHFLDSAARASKYHSMAGFTATDNAAPTGTYPTVCKRRYGSKPLKTSYKHEIAVRIYIKEIFRNYARFDKAFEPLVSFQEKHYVRIMGRVTESKKRTNKNLNNLGYLSHCDGCLWRKLDKVDECPNCGKETRKAGPLWTGRINDRRFTEKMIEETPEGWKDIKETIKTIDKEAEIIKPFYDIHNVCSNLSTSAPKLQDVIEQLREKGYPAHKTDFSHVGIRTSADIQDVKEIIESAR